MQSQTKTKQAPESRGMPVKTRLRAGSDAEHKDWVMILRSRP